MTGTTVTEKDYSSAMKRFAAKVEKESLNLAKGDIISQHIGWSLFQLNETAHQLKLRMDAKLSQIFAGLLTTYAYPVLASAAGVCGSQQIPPSYDYKGLILTATFPNEPPAGAISNHSINQGPYEFCPDQISVKNRSLGLCCRSLCC
jgi:hypothetical protein